MVTLDRQLHGYRQGHQLLATSALLPKMDQSIIDRLSDVAGPLRPKERFEPYLSAYPLPSGERYVLARTWQDLTVSRAGCVRTLSLIIPSFEWATAENLTTFLEALKISGLPEDSDATALNVRVLGSTPLPAATNFRGNELLEALFLEEPRPVAVFDAPLPELIAVRLLTALWPSMRRQFALSTFALSPRKIDGRDFDLVFAPKDARSKFSDWSGRRVDVRSDQDPRHRWTGAIVSRVFEQPLPQLLTSKEIGLIGGGESDADNAAALRIALLWDELFEKLDSTPTAALGLLDIANSGMVRDSIAAGSLEPALANAVRQASIDLPAKEAWDFLGAIARKLQSNAMPAGRNAVSAAAEVLARRVPESAIALLAQPDPRGVIEALVPSISNGIADALESDRAESVLAAAPSEVLARLVAEGERLAMRVANSSVLVNRLGLALPDLNRSLVDVVSAKLLPLLVEDWQLPAARPLVMALDEAGLIKEIQHLGVTNDFASSLADLVIDQAHEAGCREAVRSALARLPASSRRDALLAKTLRPTPEDVIWLVGKTELSIDLTTELLLCILRQADDDRLNVILNDRRVGMDVLRRIEAGDVLYRVALSVDLPIDMFVSVAVSVLSTVDDAKTIKLARMALDRCLTSRFDGDQVGVLARFLGSMGEKLDGARITQLGLSPKLSKSLASRNMVAFSKAPQAARSRIYLSIGEMSRALQSRRKFDLDVAATSACAQLMLEAEKVAPALVVTAANGLLPMLMSQRKDPVSPLIAAVFPLVYRELAKENDQSDLLRFMPFLEWDRCKSARHELVSCFMSSTWAPGDLALTACRAGDISKILRRTAKMYGGDSYINRIARDLTRVPEPCRTAVDKAISIIRSDWTARYSWGD